MATKTISKAGLSALVRDLLSAGTRVVAPVRRREPDPGGVEYAELTSPDQMCLDGPQPSRSLKEWIFPPSEPLFCWRQTGSEIQLDPAPTAYPETVVVGARPCDAAALEILDRVMGWDYRDEPWFGRRQATLLLVLACQQCDDSCFCTAVGLSPTSRRGADCFLTKAGDGFSVDPITPRGQALLDRFPAHFGEAPAAAAREADGLEQKVRSNLSARPDRIRGWLETHFDDPLWKRLALRCHGCGACAFVCPTCHCFDIVDEPDGNDRGTRRRSWDTCQTALFTLHTSGHNPRPDQAARYRQRLLHKFAVYPARFDEVLCTGCGRCVRVCPAGMDLVEILAEIDRAAEAPGGPR
ncbi:MAG: 4Fe-4S dicluster domain-containing protein [Deltaproteobacteria bacterium]|nr:4Fe-4S dicluster domain-containing protein [Deltaproteobacteria bacterium]